MSPPTSFTFGMASRTRVCSTGSMLARKRKSVSPYSAGICGSNFSKTFSSVFSVLASFTLSPYSPDQ